MILLEDTRNQVGKHRNIEAYCKRMGIEIVRQALDVGDYMLPGGDISVDTKENVLELAGNVMSADHRRFRAECERAQSSGIRLIVLVEEELPFGRLDMWEAPLHRTNGKHFRIGDPVTRVDPAALRKALITMQEKYGVRFRFCSRRKSPKMIIEYLKGVRK